MKPQTMPMRMAMVGRKHCLSTLKKGTGRFHTEYEYPSYLCNCRQRHFVSILHDPYSLHPGSVDGALFCLPVIIDRYRIWGSPTRASVLIRISYAAINVALVFIRNDSFVGAGRRPGDLALVSMKSYSVTYFEPILRTRVTLVKFSQNGLGYSVYPYTWSIANSKIPFGKHERLCHYRISSYYGCNLGHDNLLIYALRYSKGPR